MPRRAAGETAPGCVSERKVSVSATGRCVTSWDDAGRGCQGIDLTRVSPLAAAGIFALGGGLDGFLQAF